MDNDREEISPMSRAQYCWAKTDRFVHELRSQGINLKYQHSVDLEDTLGDKHTKRYRYTYNSPADRVRMTLWMEDKAADYMIKLHTEHKHSIWKDGDNYYIRENGLFLRFLGDGGTIDIGIV